MPTARMYLAAGAVGTKLYAVGGIQDDHNLGTTSRGTTEVFDTVTRKWSHLPTMPTARDSLAVGVVGTVLYAVGGIDDKYDKLLDTVEAYDTVSEQWSTGLPAMPTARQLLSVGVVGTTLYAIGGLTKHKVLKKTEAFDTVNKIWISGKGKQVKSGLPNMPTARYQMGLGVVGTKLYTVGGDCDDDGTVCGTVEAFDTRRSTSTNCTLIVLDVLAAVAMPLSATLALAPEFPDGTGAPTQTRIKRSRG